MRACRASPANVAARQRRWPGVALLALSCLISSCEGAAEGVDEPLAGGGSPVVEPAWVEPSLQELVAGADALGISGPGAVASRVSHTDGSALSGSLEAEAREVRFLVAFASAEDDWTGVRVVTAPDGLDHGPRYLELPELALGDWIGSGSTLDVVDGATCLLIAAFPTGTALLDDRSSILGPAVLPISEFVPVRLDLLRRGEEPCEFQPSESVSLELGSVEGLASCDLGPVLAPGTANLAVGACRYARTVVLLDVVDGEMMFLNLGSDQAGLIALASGCRRMVVAAVRTEFSDDLGVVWVSDFVPTFGPDCDQ